MAKFKIKMIRERELVDINTFDIEGKNTTPYGGFDTEIEAQTALEEAFEVSYFDKRPVKFKRKGNEEFTIIKVY